MTAVMIQNKVFFRLLCLGLLTFTTHLSATDTFDSVMQRMNSNVPVRISYRETRSLELMDNPWYASGYMFSKPPSIIIREQLEPERLLMGVSSEGMLYFDAVRNIRHKVDLPEDDPLSLNISVFKALAHADKVLLMRLYEVDFSSEKDGWEMQLNPKRKNDPSFSIIVSGPPNKPANRVVVQQEDGDVSAFLLTKYTDGYEVSTTANDLYIELIGE